MKSLTLTGRCSLCLVVEAMVEEHHIDFGVEARAKECRFDCEQTLWVVVAVVEVDQIEEHSWALTVMGAVEAPEVVGERAVVVQVLAVEQAASSASAASKQRGALLRKRQIE
jgi:hypothetical protein